MSKRLGEILIYILSLTLCSVTIKLTESFPEFKILMYAMMFLVYAYVLTKVITTAILKAKSEANTNQPQKGN
jgi:ABC-type multidrug transport system permease subunit